MSKMINILILHEGVILYDHTNMTGIYSEFGAWLKILLKVNKILQNEKTT